MMKIMIVEDEAPIRRSIEQFVEDAHSECVVVATAFNGKAALEKMKHVKPDLIITDIRMPGMDGLTFIEQVRRAHPDIHIAVISGYQEFEYARKALQEGVEDYLLKPIDLDQMKELLNKVYGSFLKEKGEEIQYALFSVLNHGTSMHIPLPSHKDDVYTLYLLYAGSYLSIHLEDELPVKLYWSQHPLRPVLNSLLEEHISYWIIDGRTDAEKWLLVQTSREHPMPTQSFAEALLNKMGHDIHITIMYSTLEDMDDLSMKAKMLRTSISKRIRFGVSGQFSLMYTEDVALREANLDSLMERKMLFALEHNNIPEFKKELKQVFQQWEQIKPTQLSLERQLKHVMNHLRHALAVPSEYSAHIMEEDLHRAFVFAQDYQQLYQYVSRIIDVVSLERSQEEQSKTNVTELMQQIDEYIQRHLAEPINHQHLSDKFGLVPSYISKLFAQYKGISPSKYLTELRIEKAKALLKADPPMLLKDIAAIVGYEDANYFSRLFKKKTGLWPTEYKQHHDLTRS